MKDALKQKSHPVEVLALAMPTEDARKNAAQIMAMSLFSEYSASCPLLAEDCAGVLREIHQIHRTFTDPSKWHWCMKAVEGELGLTAGDAEEIGAALTALWDSCGNSVLEFYDQVLRLRVDEPVQMEAGYTLMLVARDLA